MTSRFRSSALAYAALAALLLCALAESKTASAGEPPAPSTSATPAAGSATPPSAPPATVAVPPPVTPSATPLPALEPTPLQVWLAGTTIPQNKLPEPPKSDHAPLSPMRSTLLEEPSKWYGWQTLVTDAAAVGLLFWEPTVGVGTYVLGAPTVHAVHENYGRAAGSLALRLVLPTIGVFAGAGASCEGDWCGLDNAAYGAGIGALTAIVIDAAALSYETKPTKATQETSGVRFNGNLSVTPQKTQFVITGSF